MDKTEAFYGEISRKMAETGDWIILQYDYGIPYWGKPPLSTWLSALGIKLFGPIEIAPRIFILLVSVLLVVLFWRFVKETLGIEVARISTLIFTSSAIFLSTAATVMMDLVQLFSMFILMTAFWRFVERGEKRDGLIIFVGLGIGLLAKGLMILAMASLPIAVWLTWTKNWKRILVSLPWFSGLAVAALIAVPWYAAVEIDSPGFLNHFFIGEHIKRYLDPTWESPFGYNHSHPIGMIWLFYILGFAPWSLVVPAYILLRRQSWIPKGWKEASQNKFIIFLLCWAFVPGIFLTFARNIIWTYSLPAITPLAILLAMMMRGEEENSFQSSFRWVTTTVVTSVALVVIAGFYFFHIYMNITRYVYPKFFTTT